jgi:hypothetical protein
MSEEERLSIAKERIEFILKTYQVRICCEDSYYDEFQLYVGNKHCDNFKIVEINNV